MITKIQLIVLSLMVLLVSGRIFYTHYLISLITFSLLSLQSLRNLFLLLATGRSVNDLERDLFVLPVRMGGLGYVILLHCITADCEFNSSVSVTSSLIQEIIQQRAHFTATVFSTQRQAKADVVSSRHQRQVS